MRSKFIHIVVAVEFFFQGAKGVLHRTEHTVPMLSTLSNLPVIHFRYLDYAMLGSGMVLEGQTGLRPSEM